MYNFHICSLKKEMSVHNFKNINTESHIFKVGLTELELKRKMHLQLKCIQLININYSLFSFCLSRIIFLF